MKSKKQARIWARLCALALIAVMLLTSAYAGGVIPPTEAEAASAAAEGKNTALAAETVDSESPEESLGEPAHRKYIKDNGDGTYQLSLDVTGKTMTQTETEQRPVDVILVVDKSASMDNKIEEGRQQPTRLAVIQDLVKNMTTELLPAGTQNRMSIVTFSGSEQGNKNDSYVQTDRHYKDADPGKWTSSKDDINTTIDGINPLGGTNWEAGLYEANKLISSRHEDALTFVVFLSDGDPTFRYTNSDWSGGTWLNPISGAGYTQGTGNSDPNRNNYNHALIEAEKIPNDVKFFSVSIGGDADKMQNFANDLKQKGKDATYYDGKDATSLENAFDNIIETITTSGYTNVTITDTLSEYAEFVHVDANGTGIAVTRTNKNGTIEPVPNSDYELTVNPDTKQVSIRWLKMLEDDVTYTISFTVKPSQKASDEYIQNGGAYLNGIVGETGTGDTEGKPGFYSNAIATLTYNGDGNDQTIDYSKPVIPIQTTTIPVEKIWDDRGNTAHRSDSITAKLYYKESESPYGSVNLNEANGWKNEFTNIPVGSEDKFIVKENMTDDQSSYYESTITGDGKTRFTITNTLKVTSFTIQKVDENTKDPLEGARFELREAVVDGDTWSDQEHGKTYYPDGNKDFLTEEDGKATFNDIPFGNYLLYETKAPAGYKLPKDPVRVTVKAGMVTLMNVSGDKIGEVVLPTEGESTSQPDVTIPNKENDKLPVAGGAGTLWFTGGGLALAGAAALLYFKQRRKKGEE